MKCIQPWINAYKIRMKLWNSNFYSISSFLLLLSNQNVKWKWKLFCWSYICYPTNTRSEAILYEETCPVIYLKLYVYACIYVYIIHVFYLYTYTHRAIGTHTYIYIFIVSIFFGLFYWRISYLISYLNVYFITFLIRKVPLVTCLL